MAKTNRMTSDTAVNAEEREIARTMDDEKQRDDSEIVRPKEQRIEQMIGDAERKQKETARATDETDEHSPPRMSQMRQQPKSPQPDGGTTAG